MRFETNKNAVNANKTLIELVIFKTEHHLAKVEVASSSLVFRSNLSEGDVGVSEALRDHCLLHPDIRR